MPNSNLYSNVKVEGCSAPAGEQFIVLTQHGQDWFAPRRDMITNLSATLTTLAEQGLAVGGRGYFAQIGEQVGQVDEYPAREILEKCGWNGPLFARPAGDVLAPSGVTAHDSPGIAYYRFRDRLSAAGSRSDWKKKVAPMVAKDDYATFLACVPFAAVVRSLLSQPTMPASFNIVAEQKASAVRRIVLSVTGSMSTNGLVADPIGQVIARPARYIEASRDALLVLGDIRGFLCGGADKKRTNAVRSLVFDQLLAVDGSTTSHGGSEVPAFMTVESQLLTEMLDLDTETADRLQQSVPTVHIPADIFERRDDNALLLAVPKRMWGNVIEGMTGCYGHALHDFQRKLVQRRARKGPAQIAAELDTRFSAFCGAVRKSHSDQALPDELVHPFALVFAALRMAEQLKILPTRDPRSKAIWNVFKRFLAERPQPVSAASILTEVAAGSNVITVESLTESQGKRDLENVLGFVKTLKNGRRELWVLTGQKKTTFDWPLLSKLPDFKRWVCVNGEKGRQGGKKVLGGWKNARVIRFLLPE